MGGKKIVSSPPVKNSPAPAGDQFTLSTTQCSINTAGSSRPKENHSKSLPIGFVFQPTDADLIFHFLIKKIRGQPIQSYTNIQDFNLRDFNYAELTEKYKEYAVDGSEWYFFTTRERKYPNGVRPRRDAGNHEGYWKACTGSEPIKDEHGKIFGSKRILDYHMFNEAASTKASTRTDFKMVEYVVVDAEIAAFTDFCLCKIYKHRKKSPGNSDSLTDGDDTHPSAEANISSTLRADHYSGSSLPQHISNNASNLDGSQKRRLNSSLPPLPPTNHNHHVPKQEMPFVDPFPWSGNNLCVSEENALFEMKLREENQTNTDFNEVPDMDHNNQNFWGFDVQHLLTDEQRSLIRCDQINSPVAAQHQQQTQQQWPLQQQSEEQWLQLMASAAAEATAQAAAVRRTIASADGLCSSRGNSTSSSSQKNNGFS